MHSLACRGGDTLLACLLLCCCVKGLLLFTRQVQMRHRLMHLADRDTLQWPVPLVPPGPGRHLLHSASCVAVLQLLSFQRLSQHTAHGGHLPIVPGMAPAGLSQCVHKPSCNALTSVKPLACFARTAEMTGRDTAAQQPARIL
ncbi:hypothetical protein COO60DRAFT_869621 [Scenedesmus sp. NREL 46B-D3]|nr:hypothetical protein COO60DRAFT_869621 [Scenedesmus sp. NREL 46B-D3]